MPIHSQQIPGIALSALIAIGAQMLHGVVPGFGSISLALLGGILVRNLLCMHPASLQAGLDFGERRLLPLAIALLGLQLDPASLVQLGPLASTLIFASLTSALIASIVCAPAFGFDRRMGLLMGTGNAICGASAMAAAAPILQNSREQIGLGIGIINLLGTLNMLLLPLALHSLAVADNPAGILIGANLQAVGQAVAAGFSLGAPTGEVATIVKLGRVMLLAPLLLILGLLVQRGNRQSGTPTAGRPAWKTLIPPFVLGFLLLLTLQTLQLVPPVLLDPAKILSQSCLMIAMAAIGLRIHLPSLWSQAPRALGLGLTIAATQLAVTAALVYILGN